MARHRKPLDDIEVEWSVCKPASHTDDHDGYLCLETTYRDGVMTAIGIEWAPTLPKLLAAALHNDDGGWRIDVLVELFEDARNTLKREDAVTAGYASKEGA